MSKPAAFIVVKNGQTWLRTSAETEEAIRTGFIMETVPLYTAPPKREPLDNVEIMTIAAEHTWDLKRFARAIETAHGIGVDDE